MFAEEFYCGRFILNFIQNRRMQEVKLFSDGKIILSHQIEGPPLLSSGILNFLNRSFLERATVSQIVNLRIYGIYKYFAAFSVQVPNMWKRAICVHIYRFPNIRCLFAGRVFVPYRRQRAGLCARTHVGRFTI